MDSLEKIEVKFATDADTYEPYARDTETLARPWALPGTKGLQHRIGGLEKEDITGNVCYDADNHERMTHLRAKKVAGIVQDIPPMETVGAKDAKILVLGWGSTRGAITGAVQRLTDQGVSVAQGHLRHLNPLPPGLQETLQSFDHVLLPEMNTGQLAFVLQGRLNIKINSFTKVTGKPFTTQQIIDRVLELVEQGS
jgi:2-oxoglutarate ferredoxin oxidoreductase subunit alpha